MASIEFIKKRIEGKKAELEKLNAKKSRIEKAKASNWEKNPYFYSESDLKYVERDIASAEAQLTKYENDLQEAESRAASRNVPAITEFLDNWEKNCIEYFEEEYEKYKEAYKEYLAQNSKLTDSYNSTRTPEGRKEISRQISKQRKDFQSDWSHVLQFDHGSLNWYDTMRRDVALEKDRKYDDLLSRVCSIVGTIEDASDLHVGKKGDIDGIIRGTDGAAQIQTIGAGGYNIQCYHFRVLVKRLTRQ